MFVSDHWHRRFSLDELRHRLMSMPMLVVLLPFILGILAASYVLFPPYIAEVAICVVTILGWVSLPRRVSLGYAAVALWLFGYLIADYRTPHASMPYGSAVELDVEVVGIPAEREGYRVSEGRVVAWRGDDVWHRADDKVLLWLRNDDIREGDGVVIYGMVSERMSRFEPYDKLLRNRGYVGGVGIEDNLISQQRGEHSRLHHLAVKKLRGYMLDTLSHATSEAMVTGSRHAMPQMLREAYSATGLSHILAVSGLHLGIVLMVMLVIVAPLRLIHRGHRVANILIVVAIWLFATMSGLSPSVVRAAIMLTMLQLAYFSSLARSSINILAVTLFVMLLYRPSYLYDVSFQLSALAVAGILLWGEPLVRRFRGRSRLWRVVASTLIIGAVATLWTLPVVSHTFGNLPLAGVVLTPVVMLFAYTIVGCGLFALILPHPLAMPFAVVGEWGAAIQNSVVLWASEHGFTGVEYQMPLGGVLLCYALYGVVTVVAWSKIEKKW